MDRAYFGRDAGIAGTRSATSTVVLADSARPMPASLTSWSAELAEDEAIAAADTLLLHHPRTSSASTTTRTCSTACYVTLRPSLTGAERLFQASRASRRFNGGSG